MFETKSIFRKRIKNIFLCAIAEQPSSFVCLFVCLFFNWDLQHARLFTTRHGVEKQNKQKTNKQKK